MTIKKLTYINLVLFAVLFLAACSKDTIEPYTQGGVEERTPIGVTALLDAGGSSTRAANNDFDATSGDQLIAYLRHVKWNGSTGARTQEYTAGFNTLVTFTAKGNEAYTGSDINPIGLGGTVVVATKTGNVTNQAVTLEPSSPIYWDDFSANDENDGLEASKNLRDDGHYLESYYGYCYNGGTPTEDLEHGTNKENGIIKWAVQANQTTADKSAFKTSDLLWSAEQTPIAYAHVDGEGKKNHGTLVLPYTHAMSKVTINVTLHESFGASGIAFNGVTTTLHEMFSHCTCTAPIYSLTNKGTAIGNTTDITMWNAKSADESATTTCTFEAIVVPSILSVVNNFASIAGLDGNEYVIPITEAMLQKGSEHGGIGWGDQLTETEERISEGTAQAPPRTRAEETVEITRGKGYEMKSGVNYVLNVSISKQQITVSATIKDWVDVNAEGVALVQFNPNVDSKGSIADELKTHGFDVYKSNNNEDFNTISTNLTWNSTHSVWEYNPKIYWAGQTDNSYFRAVYPSGASLNNIGQGDKDILWGYACDDNANDRSKVGTPTEVAITPRTGDVPLHFEHPMSKITVKLATTSGASAVNFADAAIEISNLATSGTLELVKGSIEPAATTATAITGTSNASGVTTLNGLSSLPVIPQTIGNDAILKITLNDGTTYRLQLNKCVVAETTDPVAAWQRGKHYTYTIQVDKEQVIFRALIKEWEEASGNGNANLEWD